MSEIFKVLITVKTYPSLSRKYAELVCTAGILEDGSWIRIYPMPFRQLEGESKFSKFQWIELPLEKNPSDSRPESYKISDRNNITLGSQLGTKNKNSWHYRKQLVFRKRQPYTDLTELINKANKNELSLATFKPTKLLNFVVSEEKDKEWDSKKLEILDKMARQGNLFLSPEEVKQQFKILKKLPYKFAYKFEDENGKESTLKILDWEIGALYWNMIRAYNNEDIAIKKVKQKYWDELIKTDIHFFLGTTKEHHFKGAPNPFTIIGVFTPPMEQQLPLF